MTEIRQCQSVNPTPATHRMLLIFSSLLIVLAVLDQGWSLSIPAYGTDSVGYGTIQRVSILTSSCDKCGMTRLGRSENCGLIHEYEPHDLVRYN